MLASTGSAEISEWISELKLRAEDQAEAIRQAKEEHSSEM